MSAAPSSPSEPSPPGAPLRPHIGKVLRLLSLVLLAVGAGVVIDRAVLHFDRRFQRSLEPDAAQQTFSQARRIYNACQAYFSTRGHFPPTLDDLVPDYIGDRHSLADPGHPQEGEPGYYYYASDHPEITVPNAPFLISKATLPGGHAIITFDGQQKHGKPPEP